MRVVTRERKGNRSARRPQIPSLSIRVVLVWCARCVTSNLHPMRDRHIVSIQSFWAYGLKIVAHGITILGHFGSEERIVWIGRGPGPSHASSAAHAATAHRRAWSIEVARKHHNQTWPYHARVIDKGMQLRTRPTHARPTDRTLGPHHHAWPAPRAC